MNKKTHFLSILLVTLFTIAVSHSAAAYDFMVDGLCYDINEDGVTVTVTMEYPPNKTIPGTVEGSTLNIPATVTYEDHTYTVTAIGWSAFSGYSILTEFNITRVIIPNTVTSIEGWAFNSCTGLTSVEIPNSVTFIGYGAFVACTGLTSIFIPRSVTTIEYDAFGSCSSLTSIVVDSNNPIYDSRDNCNAIIETASNKLLYGCQNTAIPYSVTTIGASAFSGCTGLTSISIPHSVTTIEGSVFAYCSNLSSIAIPYTVTTIGESAFYNCPELSTITLTGHGSWDYNSNGFNHKGLFSIINQFKTVNIGCDITALKDFNFKPDVVNCYAPTPPTCSASTFASYHGQLHVPTSAAAVYFTAPYWENFSNLSIDLTASIALNTSSANLILNNQLQLTATPSDNADAVVWSTTNPSVATIDENGLVTAVGQGNCDIYATLASNPAVEARCQITVSYPEITSFTLSQDEVTLSQVGDTITLTATITPEIPGLQPTWTSSDNNVATVDANGVVTAVAQGECTITANVLGHSASCHVIVSGNVVITLDQHDIYVDINQIATLSPTCTPTPTELTVTSSNPGVANARLVTQDGTVMVQVLGISRGIATITVSSTDGKATPDSCLVRVDLHKGDVNADGRINVSDVTALINMILGIIPKNEATADVNHDGHINVSDVTALINIILGVA